MSACDACLRRAYLVGHLAPRIAGLLNRPQSRVAGLLGLPEERLIAAAAGNDPDHAHEFVARFDPGAARTELDDSAVLATCRCARSYPKPVLELDDPPAVLFVRGREAVLERLQEEPAVALVGTRRPSPYGAEVAYALGRGLGAAGVTVVSGLALGVDGTAHRGCLDGGGVPVAVLATGPDVVYPRRHRRLHERVGEAGLLVSELPPGSPAYRWSFPARNRIMAALAGITVVVEAAEPSGSLITADFAKDLGRAVAAVPGRITSRVARGCNSLLREGAAPITATADVLDELFGAGVVPVPPAPERPPEPEDPALRAVLEAVETGRSVDEIGALARLAPGDVRAAIGRLESRGFVVRRDLGGWERVAE